MAIGPSSPAEKQREPRRCCAGSRDPTPALFSGATRKPGTARLHAIRSPFGAASGSSLRSSRCADESGSAPAVEDFLATASAVPHLDFGRSREK